MKKIAVIGGGAGGMLAAYAAAASASVTLFEKNEKLGKKIYITGKGRCNVTNACDAKSFFENIVSNPKFMYKSFYGFSNEDLMTLIESNGVPLKTERGNRVFPVSDHASDITKALESAMKSVGVKVSLNTTITDITTQTVEGQETFKGIITDKGKLPFDACILACGGASYPAAGGTRLGYEICEKHGLSIVDISPSLVPFTCKENYCQKMQGLALKNVTLNLYQEQKKVYSEFGEMLFTHFGISGPIVLTATAKLGAKNVSGLKAFIDLKPAIPEDELDKRLLKIIEEKNKKNISYFFDGLLPKSMIPVFLELCQLDGSLKINTINKLQRKTILKTLKAFPLTITGTRGYSEAIVTKGGVSVKEVNPATMECKKIKGLYICGEMLDVDALTGGFNLQCAFSTGYAAGVHAGVSSYD